MASVRQDDIVALLRSAVESHDERRSVSPDEVVDHRSLAAVAEAEVDNLQREATHSRRGPLAVGGVPAPPPKIPAMASMSR